MEFRDFFQVDHLLENGVVERDKYEIIAFVDLFQEFFEIKRKLLFVEDAEGLCNDNGRNEDYAFTSLTGGNISDALKLSLGLSVKCQRSA